MLSTDPADGFETVASMVRKLNATHPHLAESLQTQLKDLSTLVVKEKEQAKAVHREAVKRTASAMCKAIERAKVAESALQKTQHELADTKEQTEKLRKEFGALETKHVKLEDEHDTVIDKLKTTEQLLKEARQELKQEQTLRRRLELANAHKEGMPSADDNVFAYARRFGVPAAAKIRPYASFTSAESTASGCEGCRELDFEAQYWNSMYNALGKRWGKDRAGNCTKCEKLQAELATAGRTLQELKECHAQCGPEIAHLRQQTLLLQEVVAAHEEPCATCEVYRQDILDLRDEAEKDRKAATDARDQLWSVHRDLEELQGEYEFEAQTYKRAGAELAEVKAEFHGAKALLADSEQQLGTVRDAHTEIKQAFVALRKEYDELKEKCTQQEVEAKGAKKTDKRPSKKDVGERTYSARQFERLQHKKERARAKLHVVRKQLKEERKAVALIKRTASADRSLARKVRKLVAAEAQTLARSVSRDSSLTLSHSGSSLTLTNDLDTDDASSVTSESTSQSDSDSPSESSSSSSSSEDNQAPSALRKQDLTNLCRALNKLTAKVSKKTK
ncbi:hypothetical protein RI367_007454 [Sorochytrium milnesiophthora]